MVISCGFQNGLARRITDCLHSHQFADTNATSLNWSSVIIPTEYVGKDLSLSLEDADENEAWSTSVRCLFPYALHAADTTLRFPTLPMATTPVSAEAPLPTLTLRPPRPQAHPPSLPTPKRREYTRISLQGYPSHPLPRPLVTATATADGGGATAAGAVGNAGALTGINGAFSNQMSGSALIAGAVVGIFALSL